MQRSGAEAIRTQIQSSKLKREITNITNSQNTKRTYGQPSEQLFPKRWPLSNRNRTKSNMNTHNVTHHRNYDTKLGTDNREPQQNYRIGTVSNDLLGGLNMFYGDNLALIWLFGLHDNPLLFLTNEMRHKCRNIKHTIRYDAIQ